MNIKETFLKLTSRTYPHGSEGLMMHLLPEGLVHDAFGNLYIEVGKTTTMFTSHLDTATKADCNINHVIENNLIKSGFISISLGSNILRTETAAIGTIFFLKQLQNFIYKRSFF